MNKIPFVDLRAQYSEIKDEIDTAIAAVISETAFIKGRFVDQFEQEFAQFLGIKYAIGCGNGTDALEIALRALGVKCGDEMLVPAQSFIATSEAVSAVGAKPVFVDIDPATHCIDVNLIAAKITPKTRAIIPVHLYGLPANMPAIMELAERHRLLVLEDVAQAHGARCHGKLTGTWGHAATFSFFPGKNLGAYGDGGMIVTNDRAVAEMAQKIANHGRIGKYDHEFEGRNSRLDGLQAAILSVKLRHLVKWSEKRRTVADRYLTRLDKKNLKLPVIPAEYEHVFHLFVVEHPKRDLLAKQLSEHGVATGVHYPVALPFLKAYERFGSKPSDFPVAHQQMNQVLSLPMYPELPLEWVDRVADLLNAAANPS